MNALPTLATDLISFTLTAIRIRAALNITKDSWHLQFELSDPNAEVFDSLTTGRWRKWERADELWKTTCFEAFWGIPGRPNYWELNLSPSQQKWNLYHFNSYREPQPPTPSNDFEVSDIITSDTTLKCTIVPKIQIPKLEVSLASIVRTKDQTLHFATKHAGSKPDFHMRESFI